MCKWNPDPKEPDASRWCTHGHQEHQELYNPHKRYLPPRIWCNACWTVCALQSGTQVKKGLAAKLSDAFNGTTRAPPYLTLFDGTSDSRRSRQVAKPSSGVGDNRVSSPQQNPGMTPLAGPTPNQIPTGPSSPPQFPHASSGTPMSQIPTGSNSPLQLSGMTPQTGPLNRGIAPGPSSPNQFPGPGVPPMAGPPSNQISPRLSPPPQLSGASPLTRPPNDQMTSAIGPPDVQMPIGLPQHNTGPPPATYQQHNMGPMQNHNLDQYSGFEGGADLK